MVSLVTRIAVILVVEGLFLIGCSRTSSKPIPVTTTSAEARNLFEEGMDLFDCYHHAEAQAKFRNAVEADPNFALGHLGIALCQFSTSAQYSSLVQADALSQPAARSTNSATRIGISLIGEAGANALDEATKLEDRVSKGEQLWICGQRAAAEGDYDRAISSFRKLAELHPRDPRAHRLLGDCYHHLKMLDSAVVAYSRAIEEDSTYAYAHNMLGYEYQSTGDLESAERMFKRYAELLPKEPNPCDSYAEFLLRAGRYKESLHCYCRALEIDSTFTNARIGIATNLMLLDRCSEARAVLYAPYDDLVEPVADEAWELKTISPGETRIADNLSPAERRMITFAEAISFIHEGCSDSALALLERRHRETSGNSDPLETAADLEMMGWLLSSCGKYDAAEEKFEEALAGVHEAKSLPLGLRKRHEVYHHIRMGCWVSIPTGDFEAANAHLIAFEAARKDSLFPRHAEIAHSYRGILAGAKNQWELSVNELKQGVRDDPIALYYLALALEKTGKYGDAVSCYRRAAAIPGLNNLSHALVRGRAESAISRLTT